MEHSFTVLESHVLVISRYSAKADVAPAFSYSPVLTFNYLRAVGGGPKPANFANEWLFCKSSEEDLACVGWLKNECLCHRALRPQ